MDKLILQMFSSRELEYMQIHFWNTTASTQDFWRYLGWPKELADKYLAPVYKFHRRAVVLKTAESYLSSPITLDESSEHSLPLGNTTWFLLEETVFLSNHME